VVRGSRFEVAYVLALNLGLRRGEILGLDWKYINLDNRVLAVVQQVQRVNRKVQVTPPKSGKPYVIPLPESVYEGLHALWLRQGQPSGGLLFKNLNGNPLEPVMLWRDYKKQLKVAGLKDIRLHDLRHSAATLLANEGADLTQISKMLGHSSPAITDKIYAHLKLPRMRETATLMDKILGKRQVAG
jgi:integrase